MSGIKSRHLRQKFLQTFIRKELRELKTENRGTITLFQFIVEC